MFDENNTIVILACSRCVFVIWFGKFFFPANVFGPIWNRDTFMDNLLTTSEEYIFFNSNMLSERLMVITAETEERQEALIHKIYDEFSTKKSSHDYCLSKRCVV